MILHGKFLTGPIPTTPEGRAWAKAHPVSWREVYRRRTPANDNEEPRVDWSKFEGVNVRALLLAMGEPR